MNKAKKDDWDEKEMMKKYFPYYKEPTEATRIGNITEFMENLPEPESVLDDAKRIRKINFE